MFEEITANNFPTAFFFLKIVNFRSNNSVTHTGGRDNYVCYNQTAKGQRQRKTLKATKEKQDTLHKRQ